VGFREAFTGTSRRGEKFGDENWWRNSTTEDVFERFMGTGVTSRREDKDGVSLLRRDAAEVFTTENLSARVPSCEETDTEEVDYWWGY